jgi:hypothetical protein
VGPNGFPVGVIAFPAKFGFGFYTLSDEMIQQFREDGEQHCMYCEDK